MTGVFLGKIIKVANPGKRALGTARLTSTERQMSTIIGEAIRGLTADIDTEVLSRALASRSVERVIGSFSWASFGDRMSTTRIPLLQQLRDTGVAEARSLTQVIGSFAFDVTDPRAVTWAAARSGDLVVGIGELVRSEIRGTITSAFINQIDAREVAASIPRTVGLFPRWANAVENSYQRNLLSLLADGLSPSAAASRAAELADAYRERLIDARSTMIARTETMTAANEGRFISWQQAGDRGLIDPANSSKEWLAEGDACEECSILDGEVVALNDDFSSDDGMPPAHPNCRCTAVLIPEPVDQAQETSLDERDAVSLETDE